MVLDSRIHKNTYSAWPTTILGEEECASSAAWMLIAMIADKVTHTICHLKVMAFYIIIHWKPSDCSESWITLPPKLPNKKTRALRALNGV